MRTNQSRAIILLAVVACGGTVATEHPGETSTGSITASASHGTTVFISNGTTVTLSRGVRVSGGSTVGSSDGVVSVSGGSTVVASEGATCTYPVEGSGECVLCRQSWYCAAGATAEGTAASTLPPCSPNSGIPSYDPFSSGGPPQNAGSCDPGTEKRCFKCASDELGYAWVCGTPLHATPVWTPVLSNGAHCS
jgi:hypothetical protein